MKKNNWVGLCVFIGVSFAGASGLSHGAEIVGVGNKCLDVTGGENANGTPVQTWKCDPGHENQNWTVDGGRIVWTGTKKCLDVSGGDRANGTQVQIWQCEAGNENQQWTLDNGRIVWTGTKKCLDVSGGGTANGTKVQIWQCEAGNENQAWTIKSLRSKSR